MARTLLVLQQNRIHPSWWDRRSFKKELVSVGGGLSRVFYGSVAAGVLNRVDRLLLVIRSRKE
jgi:hypothetical protein